MAYIDEPHGKPRVRWRDPDGRERSRTCATAAAARSLLSDVQRAEDLGRIWQPEKRREVPSLRLIAGAWIKAQARLLAPSTVDRYATVGDLFLAWVEAEHGAGALPSVLSRALCERWWDHLVQHRGLKESTAHKHVETVLLLWEWAADREEYGEDVPRPRRVELPQPAPRTPRAAPTWTEMDLAIEAATGWQRALFVVLRCTGLRVRQAMALRWSDIEGGHLTLRGELGKSRQERAGRVLPLAPVLLAEWAAPRIASWTDPVFVVAHPGTRRIDPTISAGIWLRSGARSAAWVGRPHHAFRAGFQTGLRAAGVAKESTEYLVGHAMAGLDVHYIDPTQALHLAAAVAKVPAFDVLVRSS